MNAETRYFIYLLEHYADYKKKSTGEVLTSWDALGITNKIYSNYWLYHTEAIENAYADIDRQTE